MSRLFAAALLACIATTAAAAQDKGCDISPTSYATVVPAGRGTGAVTTAAPQTPCAVIPNGWENAIGPIGVEVTPRDRELDMTPPGAAE